MSKFLIVNSFFHFGGRFFLSRGELDARGKMEGTEMVWQQEPGREKKLAAGAVLADGFVDEGVEFGASERDFSVGLSRPSLVSGSSAPPPGGGVT